MSLFKLHAPYETAGDQPQAVKQMLENLRAGCRSQILHGVTGSGKTFTLANVIAQTDKPVLVLSHNKTLAAQLYSEFKAFFPENAVEYFISYYDYYLPESYLPQTDTYIAKDASINEDIERLRLSATASLLERRDVICVSSVSCIYGLGSPDDYADMCVHIEPGDEVPRDEVLRRLIGIQYTRNDAAPERGEFRVRGDTVDIFEPQRDDFVRLEFFGDSVEKLERRDALTGRVISRPRTVTLFPCRHFVLPPERVAAAAENIRREMEERVRYFEAQGRAVEAQRIYQRVTYDLEMIREIGYCSGIENYSMHLSGRAPGVRPGCLLDFFRDDFLTVIDESHATVPQIRAMYLADRSRKETLVEHGFRLPSALENRPLRFPEFENLLREVIYVSATPAEYELERSAPPVELVVRPTGLLDPEIEIRPLEGELDDVIAEIRDAVRKGQRTLVTTLTKKNAERIADYLTDIGVRAAYLHSELNALERVQVLNRLREGNFDCVVGINLLREGLDLPEVALVAILDADTEGFLRSERSLTQTAGRAARNAGGRVILYADKLTPAIQSLTEQTAARRERQKRYNAEHHIVPRTVLKQTVTDIGEIISAAAPRSVSAVKGKKAEPVLAGHTFRDITEVAEIGLAEEDLEALINELTGEMREAAEALEFERAADIRDRIRGLKKEKK